MRLRFVMNTMVRDFTEEDARTYYVDKTEYCRSVVSSVYAYLSMIHCDLVVARFETMPAKDKNKKKQTSNAAAEATDLNQHEETWALPDYRSAVAASTSDLLLFFPR